MDELPLRISVTLHVSIHPSSYWPNPSIHPSTNIHPSIHPSTRTLFHQSYPLIHHTHSSFKTLFQHIYLNLPPLLKTLIQNHCFETNYQSKFCFYTYSRHWQFNTLVQNRIIATGPNCKTVRTSPTVSTFNGDKSQETSSHQIYVCIYYVWIYVWMHARLASTCIFVDLQVHVYLYKQMKFVLRKYTFI